VTKNNRRYAAYPKQRDLAQVFVRWALDHVEEEGAVSYNTIDTWLNAKISDGALETRKLIDYRLREVLQDSEIARYSEGGGGDVRTFIVVIGVVDDRSFTFNGTLTDYDDILEPGFSKAVIKHTYPFVDVPATTYVHKLLGGRSKNKFGTNTKFWKSFVYLEDDECGLFVLVCKCRICGHYTTRNGTSGNFKLIKTNDFTVLLDKRFEGEVKNCLVAQKHGLWLLGYLNTQTAFSTINQWTNTIGNNNVASNNELSNNMWRYCRVPDFDHYKTQHSAKFATYMTWVEANMRDKDAFLAGIDEQFEALIG